MSEFDVPLPQETLDNLQLDASVVSPAEAAKVNSLATLISQTINSEYGKFIPRETIEANAAIGKRVIVTDDLMTFDNAWIPSNFKPLVPNGVNGIAFQ